MPSTVSVQTIVNFAATHLDLLPLAGVGGYTNEPALSIAQSVLQKLLAPPEPVLPGVKPLILDWKFNRVEMPSFVTTPYRQDYKFAGATFFSQSMGAGIDLAANNALTIVSTTVTIKLLETYLGNVGDTCFITGTGSSYDSTFTQTISGSSWGGQQYVITAINGLTITATATNGTPSGTSGSAGINNFGWLSAGTMVDYNQGGPVLPTRVLNAVRDIQPSSQAAGIPTEVAMIQDLGPGVLRIRFYTVPGTRPWMVNLVYQAAPPTMADLNAKWAPFPDTMKYVYQQGFLAAGYRYLNSPKADVEEAKFEADIRRALGGDDRELSNKGLVPEESMNTNPDAWWLI